MIQLPHGLTPEQVWPWIRGLKRIVSATVPAAMPGDHLISASDYAGTHSKSRFWVCSCLIADAGLSHDWPFIRERVREQYLSDGRRMAYKSLNDTKRKAALPEFLRAADTLAGVVCSVAVDKQYEWMATTPTTVKELSRIGALSGRWGSPAFESMCRIAIIWSTILGCVSRPGQHVSWITDEDDIAANDDRLTDLLNYAGRFSSLMNNEKMGELTVNTTAFDPNGRGIEDFVSIPDLCAGMLAEVVNNWSSESEGKAMPKYTWSNAKLKADYLCDWHFAKTGTLRKVAVVIVKTPEGKMMIQQINPEITDATTFMAEQ